MLPDQLTIIKEIECPDMQGLIIGLSKEGRVYSRFLFSNWEPFDTNQISDMKFLVKEFGDLLAWL